MMTSYSSPKSVWWYEWSNLICLQWLPMNSWTTFRSRLPLKWTFLKTPSLRARSSPIAGTLKTPELEQALSLSALKVRKWFNPHIRLILNLLNFTSCVRNLYLQISFSKKVYLKHFHKNCIMDDFFLHFANAVNIFTIF